ncbi:MAG: tripartite tricarboxylate transporter substrate binding protein [Pigmentiphaga sp.]
MTRSFSKLTLAATAMAASMGTAVAECDWRPTRAVTVIVPWAAGGGTDASARMLANLLERRLEVPFNVINRTGGNGVTGHSAIVNAAPDGYTLGAATADINTMHWVGMTKMTQVDMTPLTLIDFSPSGVMVKADSQFKSLPELLEYARENPGKLTASGTAHGGIWHLALAGMLNAEGLPADAIRWIPSQGGAAALRELVASGVDVATPSLSEGLPLIRAGEIRPLGYMHSERMLELPEVPTTAETLPSGWTLAAWAMLAAPANLPEEIACSYEKEMLALLNGDEWKEFKASRGGAVVNMTRQELAKMVAENDEAMGAAIKAAGLGK